MRTLEIQKQLTCLTKTFKNHNLRKYSVEQNDFYLVTFALPL
jgi:hypothetical protein